jgi:hypothetical protein
VRCKAALGRFAPLRNTSGKAFGKRLGRIRRRISIDQQDLDAGTCEVPSKGIALRYDMLKHTARVFFRLCMLAGPVGDTNPLDLDSTALGIR